jgi:uncharacterized repeat protein (TIGR03803 family)
MGLLISSAYAAAQNPPPSLTTIYSFTSGTDGGNPDVPLIIGEGGVLYGATYWGGNKNYGAVFSLTAPASPGGTWAEAVLYSFQGGNDGFNPDTRLAMGSGGVLYGTTNGGGKYNYGTAFSLTPPASPGGPWTKAEIYPFFVADGTYPDDMAISPAGVLYGNTLDGGAWGCCGTVFAIVPPASPGGRWIESVLYTFPTQPDPLAGVYQPHVVIGKNLVLYGTICLGGENNAGAVFSLSPPGPSGGAWTYTQLYSFGGYTDDGVGPYMGVVIGADGVLYGSTAYGGSSNGGTIFSLTPPASPGGAWTEAVLHDFPLVSSHNAWPGPLALGEDGTLYGTTQFGGASVVGTAYALKPPATPGGAWTEVLLHAFTGSDGSGPTGLALAGGGVLYGTTSLGGAYGAGTVFALTE